GGDGRRRGRLVREAEPDGRRGRAEEHDPGGESQVRRRGSPSDAREVVGRTRACTPGGCWRSEAASASSWVPSCSCLRTWHSARSSHCSEYTSSSTASAPWRGGSRPRGGSSRAGRWYWKAPSASHSGSPRSGFPSRQHSSFT